MGTQVALRSDQNVSFKQPERSAWIKLNKPENNESGVTVDEGIDSVYSTPTHHFSYPKSSTAFPLSEDPVPRANILRKLQEHVLSWDDDGNKREDDDRRQAVADDGCAAVHVDPRIRHAGADEEIEYGPHKHRGHGGPPQDDAKVHLGRLQKRRTGKRWTGSGEERGRWDGEMMGLGFGVQGFTLRVYGRGWE